MGILYRELPGLACDFSGTASFVRWMNGMGVIHAPVGCIGNYAGFDEPDWFTDPGMILSSSMGEDEAILGLDDVVIDKSVVSINDLHPDFYTLIGCPPPALIGTDYAAICSIIEKRTGVPCIPVDTTGFDNYVVGADKFLTAMADRFLGKKETVKGTANVMGYNHLDYRGDDDLKDLISILGDRYDRINTCDSLESFKDLTSAEINIVVSSSALHLAHIMKNRFGIPFTCDLPVFGGDHECIRDTGKKVLMIGDQVIINSIRDMMEARYGCICDVASFFGLDDSIADGNDVSACTEAEFKDLLTDGYDMVVGDPLFRKFTELPFIELPHVAVSSRLFWNSHVPLFRKESLKLFDRAFDT